MGDSIRILMVDDHAIVRTGINALIEAESDLELAGEAINGKEAVEKFKSVKPDVVLMDLIMPQMNGIEAIKAIRKKSPKAKILVLTSFSEDDKVIAAIKSGAMGYILKDSSPQELIQAIRDVSEGKPFLHPTITRIIMRDMERENNDPEPIEPLTEREIDVLVLVAQGLSNQEIADRLIISVTTVRFHVTNVLTKLHLDNRTQAALYAIRKGLATL